MILVVVFVLGLGAGIAGMVWAWPGLRAKYFPRHREHFVAMLTSTLKLTQQQVPQVQAVVQDTRERSHQIHLQFVPRYDKVCEDFLQIVHEEHDAFTPLGQQESVKLKAIMTPAQWQKYEAQRPRQPRPPDFCRHGSPTPGGPAAPGQPRRR
ncbi:MAG: hypothetical protein ACRD1E_10630 [Terriglobales bacterium]